MSSDLIQFHTAENDAHTSMEHEESILNAGSTYKGSNKAVKLEPILMWEDHYTPYKCMEFEQNFPIM